VSRLFEALRNSADGAFVIDENLRIVYWNRAAETILGFDRDDVAGQFCYQLLHGYDDSKRLICKERCRVVQLALQSKPIPNYDLHVATRHGETCWLNMSVFTYRMSDANGKKAIVHLFHDLDRKEVDDKVLGQLVKVINRYHDIRHKNGDNKLEHHQNRLTSREREILALLADGHGTRDIAQLLTISIITVRNHIQHILQKLQVHTRLEAVAIATKYNLIG
jgi:PAS domain S-box-containing protein